MRPKRSWRLVGCHANERCRPPIHVLFVHNDYGRPSGEEQAVATMATVLSSDGHQISWLRRSSAEIGNSVTRKVGAFFSGIYSASARREMAAILRDQTIDIVQVQNLYPFLSPSVLLAARDAGVPVVMRCSNYRLFCPTGLHLSKGEICERCLGGREWQCVLHNCENDLFKSFGYAIRNASARLSGAIKDNVTVFIVLSEFQKRRFIAGGIPEERLVILPNTTARVPHEVAGQIGDSVAFIGRMSEEKGIREFLAAAARLPGIRFVVAGDPRGTDLTPDALPPNVSLRGFLTGERLEDVYNRARIVVCPSKCFEAFPNVIVEAMVRAKPVIASRIGAIPEIVEDDRTGVLVDPGEPGALADAIEKLWMRPDACQAMGLAGQRRAAAVYSADAFRARLYDIYESALRLHNAR
jgi:glycosyltransferase involved in cell wall biosynthesis